MKTLVWVYLLGLCLNCGWAMEEKEETPSLSVETSESISAKEETSSHKFSNLVKSTMDLMGPELTSPESQQDQQAARAPKL